MSKTLIKGKVFTLDRCPFCGCDTARLQRPVNGFDMHSVQCDPCNAVVFGKSRTDALEAWNRRPYLSDTRLSCT